MQDSSNQATVEASMLRIQYATQRGIELTCRLTGSSEDSRSIAAVKNVNDVLNNAVSLLAASAKQNSIDTVFFEPAPRIIINANEFEDALINICINGIHAMTDVGQLTIADTGHGMSAVNDGTDFRAICYNERQRRHRFGTKPGTRFDKACKRVY